MSAPHGPRRLAAACRAHAAPVYLETGRFAPPHARAVWQLPTPADNVVVVQWYPATDAITVRILTGEEGGAC